MKWLPVFVLAAALVAGCGSQEAASESTVAAAAVEPPEAGVVHIDPDLQKEVGIAVERVERRALPEVIRATGRITINENRTWRVGAVTEGRIVQLFAREGDMVERGQILARMHSHDIHEARAEYRRAVAELDRLKANVAYARSVRDRTKRLYELKAASLQQLEQAEAELNNAETALAHGEVELIRTRTHLESFLGVPADVPENYRHDDENIYDLVPIAAPAGGTLLKRLITTGTVVAPSQELFVITDLSTLWMIAAVSEEHLSKLRLGMPVRIYVQAYPGRAFRGKLTKLGTELDPTTRTIMARVEVPNEEGLLKPEMYATAELELTDTREALFLPEVAVQEVDGAPTVFVRTAPDRFEPRQVTVAPASGGNVEVLSGLRPGEEVAVEGGFLLKSQLLKSTLAED